MIVAISVPLQIQVQQGEIPSDPAILFTSISLLNWVAISIAIIFSYLVYTASLWAWVAMPAFMFVIGWSNWLTAASDSKAYLAFWTIVVMAALLCYIFFFAEKTSQLFSDPNLRWWRNAPRLRISVNANVKPPGGDVIVTETFDLSKSGAFIAMPNAPAVKLPQKTLFMDIPIGTQCVLKLNINNYWAISCMAVVVRHSIESRGQYPSGFAVQFVNLKRRDRMNLESYLKSAQHAVV